MPDCALRINSIAWDSYYHNITWELISRAYFKSILHAVAELRTNSWVMALSAFEKKHSRSLCVCVFSIQNILETPFQNNIVPSIFPCTQFSLFHIFTRETKRRGVNCSGSHYKKSMMLIKYPLFFCCDIYWHKNFVLFL